MSVCISALNCNRVLLVAMVFLTAFIGCRKSGIGTIPVEGTITVDGQPMEGVTVVFNPDTEGNRAASGRTDAQGHYVLTTLENGDGALAGSYKIAITKFEGEARDPSLPTEVDPDDEASLDAIYSKVDTSKQSSSKNLIAARYANHLGSGLAAKVESGGDNVFDFEVEGAK